MIRLILLLLALCLSTTVQGQAAPRTFTPYTASTANFANPERGFYHQDAPMWVGTQTLPQSVSGLAALRTRGISTVRWYFLIDEFVSTDLSSAALTFIGQQFDAARAAGIKVIPRFAYNFPTDGTFPYTDPDATLTQTLTHIQQLTPVLTAHADVIAFMEMGFVGAWGEWHSSTNGHVHYTNGTVQAGGQAIINAVLAALPATRMTAMRYAPHKQQLYGPDPLTEAQAFNGTAQARIGAHNDCFLASRTDWGTYPSDAAERRAVRRYLSADNRYLPQGGETCNAGPDAQQFIGCSNALTDLALLRFSALNIDYNEDVLNVWRSQGCFGQIARRLGYRFRLIESSIPSQAQAGETAVLTLVLQNDGFAAPYNPRGFEIVLRAHADGQLYRPTLVNPPDPRRWLPDAGPLVLPLQMQLPPTLPAGTYDVLLHLPDPEPTLYGRPEYSIRLANTGVWEADTGFNDLLADLVVQSNAGSSTDLLVNGGFEAGLSSWQVQRAAGTPTDDRVLCGDKGAASSACAFRFRGGAGENTRLSQRVTLANGDLQAGDILTVRLAYSARPVTNALNLTLIAHDADGRSVTLLTLPATTFKRTTTRKTPVYDVRLRSLPPLTVDPSWTSLTLRLRYRAGAGTLWVDDLRLTVTRGANQPAALPLP